MTAPKAGSLPWHRAWLGEHVTRGHLVRARGRKAVVLSARGDLIYVRDWSTGARVGVRQHEIGAA